MGCARDPAPVPHAQAQGRNGSIAQRDRIVRVPANRFSKMRPGGRDGAGRLVTATGIGAADEKNTDDGRGTGGRD
jgi:hypothetical protein